VERLDCLVTTFEFFALNFKSVVDVFAKLAVTSTALTALATTRTKSSCCLLILIWFQAAQ